MINQFKHRTTKSDIAKDKTRFVCTVPRCGKTYSRNQRLKSILSKNTCTISDQTQPQSRLTTLNLSRQIFLDPHTLPDFNAILAVKSFRKGIICRSTSVSTQANDPMTAICAAISSRVSGTKMITCEDISNLSK